MASMMLSPEALSVFLNSLIFLAPGPVCAYVCFSQWFSPKRSLWLFMSLFYVKVLVIATIDTMVWYGIDSPFIQVGSVFVSTFGFLWVPIAYYSWNADIANIIITPFFADGISGFALLTLAVIEAVAFGTDVQFNYIGPISLLSFIRPAFALFVMVALCKVAKPLGRRLFDAPLKYRVPLATVALASVVLGASAGIPALSSDVVGGMTIVLLGATVFLGILVVLMFSALRHARRRSAWLARQRTFANSYEAACREQVSLLEQSRGMLDNMAARIQEAGTDPMSARWQGSLDELRKTCDRLRFGTYSDNPALDVVLMEYEDRLHKAGCRVAYRVSPLSCFDDRVALAAQGLLEWALQATRGTAAPVEVDLRIFRRAGRVFMETAMLGAPYRTAYRRHFGAKIAQPGMLVQERWDASGARVRLVMDEASG